MTPNRRRSSIIVLLWLLSLVLNIANFFVIFIPALIFGSLFLLFMYAYPDPSIFVCILSAIIFLIGLYFFIYIQMRIAHAISKLIQKFTNFRSLLLYDDIKEGIQKRFCVFLRPFYSAGKFYVTELYSSSGQLRNFSFEAQLAKAAKRIGPVLAVGALGDNSGIGQLFATEEEWKRVVIELIDKAIYVFCVPSIKSGTLWEIEYLIAHNHLHKTVFFMPPTPPQGVDNRLTAMIGKLLYIERFNEKELVDDWAQLLVYMRAREFDFPKYNKEGLFFSPGSSLTALKCEKINLTSARTIRKGIEKLVRAQNAVSLVTKSTMRVECWPPSILRAGRPPRHRISISCSVWPSPSAPPGGIRKNPRATRAKKLRA